MSLKIVNGNLLDATETYLCHQTNCVTKVAAHCAKSVFDRFPYANIYAKRLKPSEPGTIDIRGDGPHPRWIINMMGQIYPGRPKMLSGKDTSEMRIQYFLQCLKEMEKLGNASFAFSYIIGCGAAGGSTVRYLDALCDFSKVKKVTLYRM